MKVLQVLILTALQVPSMAWWGIGHKTIAAIAKSQMKNPSSIEQIGIILNHMEAMYDTTTGYTAVEQESNRPTLKSSDMVSAAVYPDVAKNYSVHVFNEWHYVGQEYDPENLDVDNTGCGSISPVNAVTQTLHLLHSLITFDVYKQTPKWYTKLAVIYLIHVVADLHQPLHDVTRCLIVEDELTNDLGGNLWTFYMPDGSWVDLHSFWDSGQFHWTSEEQDNIESNDPFYESRAADFIARHTPETLEAAGYNTNFSLREDPGGMDTLIYDWIAEGYSVAKESYSVVPLNGTISQENVDKAYARAEELVALAGYRMAAMFDGLLANASYFDHNTDTSSREVASRLLDIHIKLSEKCEAMARIYNSLATDILKENQSLDFASSVRQPHITLYLADFEQSKISELVQIVKNFVWTDDCVVNFDHSRNAGNGQVVWEPDISQPACLRSIADHVVQLTSGYIVRPVEAKLPKWIADLPEPDKTDLTENFYKFGSPNVSDYFYPRVIYAAVNPGFHGDLNSVVDVIGTPQGSGKCTYTVAEIGVDEIDTSGTILAGKVGATGVETYHQFAHVASVDSHPVRATNGLLVSEILGALSITLIGGMWVGFNMGRKLRLRPSTGYTYVNSDLNHA
eukprot:CFRG4002T1